MRKFPSVAPGPDGPNPGDLIPYYMTNKDGEPWCYNDIAKWGSYAALVSEAQDSDPFLLNTENTIPPR
jgi:hypothetical protein